MKTIVRSPRKRPCEAQVGVFAHGPEFCGRPTRLRYYHPLFGWVAICRRHRPKKESK